MSNINHRIRLIQNDGTEFSTDNEADAKVRLRESNISGDDVGAYGDFSEVGNGIWEINIDSGDSGYFRVETSTDAGSTYSPVTGMSPTLIQLSQSVDTSSIQSVTGKKFFSGDNEHSGAESFSGNVDFSAFVDIAQDKLKIDGTALTITAAEANILDGATLSTNDLNAIADKDAIIAKWLTDVTGESISAPSNVQETDTHVVVSVDEITDSGDNALVGKYHFNYVFDNTADNDPTLTDNEIISGDNVVKIEKPNNGDEKWNSDCYLHVRVQFENATGNTGWSDTLDTGTIDEPESTLTDAGVVELLASGSDNATSVLKAIANLISDNSTIGRIMAEQKKSAYLSGAGTPGNVGVSADYVGQDYLDTSTSPKTWYKAIDTGNEDRADDWTQV